MVSKLKEKPTGGFYCSECRMSVPEPVDTCPFCGSIIINWEELARKCSDLTLENPNLGGPKYESNIS